MLVLIQVMNLTWMLRWGTEREPELDLSDNEND